MSARDLIKPINEITKCKVLVIGHGGHGKTTVGMLIGEERGLSYCDSSYYAAREVIYPAMRDEYPHFEACYDDRRNRRQTWGDLIEEYNTPDPTRLCRELLEQYDMYIGMRRVRELWPCLEAGLFDIIYWVDASRREPLEPSGSMNLDLKELTDHPARKVPLVIVDNNQKHPLVSGVL